MRYHKREERLHLATQADHQGRRAMMIIQGGITLVLFGLATALGIAVVANDDSNLETSKRVVAGIGGIFSVLCGMYFVLLARRDARNEGRQAEEAGDKAWRASLQLGVKPQDIESD